MRRTPAWIGQSAVAVLSLVPLVVWVTMMPLKLRFLGLGPALTSMGQVTGLVGMAMFSLALVLHLRMGVIEGLFGGLDRVYRAHHVFGGVAFALLLFHPVFLALRFVSVSVRDAALFLLPGKDHSINFGIYALVLLEALLVITFFIKWKYQKWKFSHSFLSLAFFLASLHVFFVSSDVSRNIVLWAYMLILAVVGLLAFVVRKVFPPDNRYEYRVQQVTKLNAAITEVSLMPTGKVMAYRAGQFAYVSFWSRKVSREWHPFSISSSPDEAGLRFTVKDLGDFTSALHSLKEDDQAIVEGPYGRFSYELCGRNQLWIAAGIGITPFLSMARSVGDHLYQHSFVLVYVVSGEEEAIYLGELRSKVHKAFKLILYESSKEGRVTAEKIMQKVKDASEREILICGPPPMMQSLKKQFAGIGVKSVHTEEFVMV